MLEIAMSRYSPISVIRLLSVLVLIPFAGVVAADVYKSVDAQGEVTYSDTPPPRDGKSEEVKLGPEPTAAQIREAEERQRAMAQSAEELEQARKQYEDASQSQQTQQPVVAPTVEVSPQNGTILPRPDYPGYPVRPGYGRPLPEQRPVERPVPREDVREDERFREGGRGIRR